MIHGNRETIFVRVLFFYPWGQFHPVTCGADYVACNQMEYFQSRGWEVHCVLPRGFGRGLGDVSQIPARFPCVQSVRLIDITARAYSLRDVLFAFERAAGSQEFLSIAVEPFDLFFANYVLSAPFAARLARSVFKVVETHDIQSRMFRKYEDQVRPSPMPLLRNAEERFALTQIEVDLYRVFDQAVMISEEETETVHRLGYTGARYVPQVFPVTAGAPRIGVPATFDLAFVGSENHLNTAGVNWFYRHVYVPHLRARQVSFAVAGRVCERMLFEDSCVFKLGRVENLDSLYDSTRLVVIPILEGTGIAIKLHEALAAGRAVVTTPLGARGLDPESGAFSCTDMKHDPQAAAEAILGLLADDARRSQMQHAAVALMAAKHSRDAYGQAMDRVFDPLLAKAPQRRAA